MLERVLVAAVVLGAAAFAARGIRRYVRGRSKSSCPFCDMADSCPMSDDARAKCHKR